MQNHINDIPNYSGLALVMPIFIGFGIALYYIIDIQFLYFCLLLISFYVLSKILCYCGKKLSQLNYFAHHVLFTQRLVCISHLYQRPLRYIGFLGFFLLIGAVSAFVSHRIHHFPIDNEYLLIDARARVIEIEHFNKSHRLLLDGISLDGGSCRSKNRDINTQDHCQSIFTIRKKYNNYRQYLRGLLLSSARLRIKAPKDTSLEVGDLIIFSAQIFPPDKPTWPSIYNFSKIAFFKNIIAVGYAIQPVTIFNAQERNISHIQSLRYKIQNRLINALGHNIGGLVSAILVGKKDFIDLDLLESIRDAGMSHLFAISGLHLLIVSLLSFKALRRAMAFFPSIALRYDIKKIASVFGVLCSFIYLIMAGMPISAKRAFLMSLMSYLGIIFDEKMQSKYALTIAASMILISDPYSMFNPGFQLSFVAVGSLILSSEIVKNENKYKNNWLMRYLVKSWRIVLSSLVTSLFTAPYSIYNFQSFSINGIFANIVAIPLMTMIIMPLSIISLITLNSHIFNISIIPLNFAMEMLIKIAKVTNDMNPVKCNIAFLPSYSIFIVTLGFVVVFLISNTWRYVGILLIIVGMISSVFYQKADLLMHKNSIAFIGAEDKLYFLNKHRLSIYDKFWLKIYNHSVLNNYILDSKNTEHHVREGDMELICSNKNCILHKYGYKILMMNTYFAFECDDYDLILTGKYDLSECPNAIDKNQALHTNAIFLKRSWFAKIYDNTKYRKINGITIINMKDS